MVLVNSYCNKTLPKSRRQTVALAYLLLIEIHNYSFKASIAYKIETIKGPVKLIKRVKIAHSFLQYVSNQFHVIISSLPV